MEVVLPDAYQLQARKEKRGERYMRCHRIQYTDKTLEWVLLSWPDRPTRVRKAGESQSAKWKAKKPRPLVGLLTRPMGVT